MKLTEEQKAQRARDRMLGKAKEMSASRYGRKYVAPVFQAMIRAEHGAVSEPRAVIVEGNLSVVHSPLGTCACVTCGKVLPWSSPRNFGDSQIQAGHYLAGRYRSTIFEEGAAAVAGNVAPQCSACNGDSGRQADYTRWMNHIYTEERVDALRRQHNQSVSWEREDLVDRLIAYRKRLKAAEAIIERGV